MLGTPKNIITSDADNSMIQLTTFEFSFVFTFSRSLMSLSDSFQSTLPALIIPMRKLYSMLRRRVEQLSGGLEGKPR